MEINEDLIEKFFKSEIDLTIGLTYVSIDIPTIVNGSIVFKYNNKIAGVFDIDKNAKRQGLMMRVDNVISVIGKDIISVTRNENKLEISVDHAIDIYTISFIPEAVSISTNKDIDIYELYNIDKNKEYINKIEICAVENTDVIGAKIELLPDNNLILNSEKGWETRYAGIIENPLETTYLTYKKRLDLYASLDRSGIFKIVTTNEFYKAYIRIYKKEINRSENKEDIQYIPERKEGYIHPDEIDKFYNNGLPLLIEKATSKKIDILPEFRDDYTFVIFDDEEMKHPVISIYPHETLRERETTVMYRDYNVVLRLTINDDASALFIDREQYSTSVDLHKIGDLDGNEMTIADNVNASVKFFLKYYRRKVDEQSEEASEKTTDENIEPVPKPKKGFYLHIYGKLYYVNGEVYDCDSKDADVYEGKVSYCSLYKHPILGWFTKWYRDRSKFSERFIAKLYDNTRNKSSIMGMYTMERYMKVGIFSVIYIILISIIENIFLSGKINHKLRYPIERKRRITKLPNITELDEDVTIVIDDINDMAILHAHQNSENIKTKVNYIKLKRVFLLRNIMESLKVLRDNISKGDDQ